MFIRNIRPSLLMATLALSACGGGGDNPGLGTTESAAETASYMRAYSAEQMAADPSADAAPPPLEEQNIHPAASSPNAVVGAATASLDLYVATTGSDSNPGTEALPFKTIYKASLAAVPGTTVHVAPGVYPGSFQTSKSGTATDRIRYVSDVKWGARIVPPAGSQRNKAWTNTGNYVDISGFQIDGSVSQSGIKWWTGILVLGSYNLVENNYVHHIATSSADCTGDGGSGINANNYYNGYQAGIVGNVISHIGSPGCITIQGIYMATSGEITNNIVHTIGNWGIHLWHDAANINITNNTVVRSGGGILVGGGSYYHIAQADYVNVSNNIVFGNRRGIMEQGNYGKHNTYFNNLCYGNTLANHILWSKYTSPISGDPQFVDYASDDFRLQGTSPAIDRGSSLFAPGFDFDGAGRPQGMGADIGAYEFR